MAVLPIGINPATGGGGAGGYQIERSLRFNRPDSAYLNRTFSTGNRKTWTWSCWIKRSTLDVGGGDVPLISSVGASSTYDSIRFNSDSTFRIYYSGGAAYGVAISGSPVFRDVSAWYHIVVAQDTTQATEANRLRVWINGVQQTLTGIPAQNYESGFNNGVQHEIGKQYIQSEYFPGYMAEAYFIDGSAKVASDFGETDSNTGVWKPKAYSGTYGTNGFYLKFADNSGTTSTTLGKDSSGNGNNWTPNNFSVTAGVGNDSLVDSPSPYGTDTGAGGEVRGNYCTLNPLRFGTGFSSTTTISDGNLKIACSSNAGSTIGTIAIPSTGKWYWEAVVPTQTYNFMMVGVIKNQELLANLNLSIGNLSTGYAVYAFNGQKYNNGSSSTYMAAVSQNTVVTVAFDADTGSLYVGAGGSWANGSGSTNQTWANAVAAYTGITGTIHPASSFDTGNCYVNFGQRPFAYTAPSGFKALCTTNLPTPTIGATSTTQANDYFNPVLYSGNGTSQTIDTGLQPDFIWIKRRDGAAAHTLTDSVRGTSKQLFTNLTDAEQTDADSGVTAISSSSMTLGDNNLAVGSVNGSGSTYVAWNWNAGGSTVTNTSGTISAQVRANTTSGFSIVTYTGTNASGATIGHGLGAVPAMIIIKNRSSAEAWPVYHAYNTSAPETDYLVLNTTAATADATTPWNDTLPTSTVFTLGNWNALNENGSNHVAYCFAPVAGYSAFGSYTGNGSSDGPFVYTGFRPAFVMLKRTDAVGIWYIWDNKRIIPANGDAGVLQPQVSDAEADYNAAGIDLLSNGFKIRNTDGSDNASSGTIIYAAFAESPFKYALAR